MDPSASLLSADCNSDSVKKKNNNSPLVQPDNDTELHPEVHVCKTNIKSAEIVTELVSCRFERFSSCKSLLYSKGALEMFVKIQKRESTETNEICEI